jgi:hypothetical protein
MKRRIGVGEVGGLMKGKVARVQWVDFDRIKWLKG